MNRFEGVLFCTDLDGTILSDDRTISKENKDAIRYFQSEGGKFTFITGRLPKASVGLCRSLAPNAPYGCSNGAGIYDPETEEYLWSTGLHPDYAELVHLAEEKFPGVGIQLNTKREIYVENDNDSLVHFRAVTHTDKVEGKCETVKEEILKVVFSDFETENILRLAALLRAHPKAKRFTFFHSEPWLLDLVPGGVDKGTVLLKMASLLGIDPKKTVAVGDYDNDAPMIRAAGLGFAVQNATPAAREAARYVTVSNNESAIAAVIDGLSNGTYRF